MRNVRSLVIILIVAFITIFGSVISCNAETVANGECGENASWLLDENGKLEISGSGALFVNYEGKEALIPDEYLSSVKEVIVNSGITSIGKMVFSYLDNVESISLSDTVTYIEEFAFDGCGAKSIELPSGIKSIEQGTFWGCYNLSSLEIPDGVTNISSYAFNYCSALQSVKIPDSVTSIESNAFDNCSGFRIICKRNSYAYQYATGHAIPYTLYDEDLSQCGENAYWQLDNSGTLTIFGTGDMWDYAISGSNKSPFSYSDKIYSIVIEDGITGIGINAFTHDSSLTSVTIADSVTVIRNAFEGCGRLKNITIPSSVNSIEGNIFKGCYSLTSINVDETNTAYKSIDGVLYDYNCTSLIACPAKKQSVHVPDSLIDIERYAFYRCKDLTGITLPDGLTTIGEYAFNECGLTDITLPYSVTRIGEEAFGYCKLTSINIPENVTFIGGNIVSGCKGFESFNVDPYNTMYRSLDGVLYDKACKEVYECPVNKDSVIIPDTVTYISQNAFSGCNKLTSIIIPDSVKNIGGYAFCGCSGLTSITISDGIWYIQQSTFMACSNLESVTIPESVTTIDTDAFRDCGNLTDVFYKGSKTKWDSITIHSGNTAITEAATIHFNSSGNVPGPEYDEDAPFTLCDKNYTHHLSYYIKHLDSSTFDGTLCSLMAAIANSAGSRSDAQKMYRTLGFKEKDCDLTPYDTFENNNNEIRDGITYSIGKRINKDGTIIVLIDLKGTEGTSDIFHDIAVTGWDDNFNCHEGFKIAADNVMLNLKNFLGGELEPDDYTYYFITGHSLGAATGNLLAAEISRIVGKKQVYNYNFACPNTVVSTKSPLDDPNAFNPSNGRSNIFNICRSRDQVPSLPGLGSSILLDAKENIQDFHFLDLFECFHKRHDFYWGKWGITKWFDDGIWEIGAAHDMGNYLKYVSQKNPAYSSAITYGENYTTVMNYIFVFCPVDVKLLNSKREVIGAVIDNEPIYYNNSYNKIQIATAGDLKCITYPADEEYIVQLTATDAGTMSYVIARGRPYDEIFLESKIYENIALTEGKTMIGTLDNADIADDQLYVVDAGENVQAVISEDGNEVEPDGKICIHLWDTKYTVDKKATCAQEGSKSIHCTKCGAVKPNTSTAVPKTTVHTYGAWKTTKKVTELATGTKTHKCSVCGKTETKTITKLAPSLPAVKITKPKAAKKAATIKWRKVSTRNQRKIAKLQIQYSLDKNFKKGVKTVYAKKSAVAKKITKLKSKKTYYVRIRAYRKSGGVVHISKWSAKKSVRIK